MSITELVFQNLPTLKVHGQFLKELITTQPIAKGLPIVIRIFL